MSIFTKNYYNSKMGARPYIKNRKVFGDTIRAYYGAITGVYKPSNEKNVFLYYYDVNSLYPIVVLQPMPGLECKDVDYFQELENLSHDLAALFYHEVTSPNNMYISLLPVKDRKFGLMLPKGSCKA